MAGDRSSQEPSERDTDITRRAIIETNENDASVLVSADGTDSAQPSAPARSGIRPSRRSILGVVASTLVGAATLGQASAGNHRGSTVPTPSVEGPITGGIRTREPMTASVPDVENWGYSEREYFISGEATAHGSATVPIGSSETAEYTTRIIVYRPTDPDRFNGSLVINWSNVTAQTDAPSNWIGCYPYLMREGYAFVAASVQKQGVDGSPLSCKEWDPIRYGSLSHPGDEFAYDIYSQMVKALRVQPRPDPDPLAGIVPRNVLAVGASQSAGYLRTYINEIQADAGVIDGFMPFVSSPGTSRSDLRDDLVPVLWVNSESEADPNTRRDAGNFRFWEIAGLGHVDHWWHAYVNYHMLPRDHGSAAGGSYEGEWDEMEEGQYGERGSSPCPSNLYPGRHAYRAALHALNEWVTRNQEPPSPPRFEYDTNGDLRMDEHMNVVGGLRLPPIDVPVATYDATRCGLHGQTIKFDPVTLQELYPTHEDYVRQMQSAMDDAVENGWILPADAESLMVRARSSTIGGGGEVNQPDISSVGPSMVSF